MRTPLPQLPPLTLGVLLELTGERIGSYDFERAAPGHIFCADCGYRHDYHVDGRCPTEAEAREASGR